MHIAMVNPYSETLHVNLQLVSVSPNLATREIYIMTIVCIFYN